MTENNNPIRDYLLGETTSPGDLPAYRENINRIVRESESRLRTQRILASLAWIFCTVSAAIWIWIAPEQAGGRAPFLACVFMIVGAVEVIKHRIESSRVHMLAEIKQLQVQLYQLEEGLRRVG